MNKKFSKRSVKNAQERSVNKKKLEGFTDLGLETYNDQSIMTSREFADRFEKRHDNIIRNIEREISYMTDDGEFSQPKNGSAEFDDVDVSDYFIVSYYKDKQGKKRKQYLLTKDGFSLVANGMTGRQAAQWRRYYIQTFNAIMEKYIREGIHLTEERNRILGQVNNLHANPKVILRQKEIERQFKLRDPKMDI